MITVIAALVLAPQAPASAAPATAVIGQPAPIFSASAADGKTYDLKSFEGKFVILEWTNKGCHYVQKFYSTDTMQSLQRKAKEKGVVWLSVCSSNVGKQGYMSAVDHLEYAKTVKADPHAILLDTEGKIGRAYGARTSPQMVLIDTKGTLLYNGAIDDRPTSDPADIPKARNHIMSALDEAMAGKPVTVTTSRPYGCGIKY